MNWYEFPQNNSGGRFITDDKVCHLIYIQAESEEEAIEKAEELGCYWDGVNKGIDCPCCGDRWSKFTPLAPERIYGIYKSFEEYAQEMCNIFGDGGVPEARLFYSNGEVRELTMNKKTK